MGRNIDIKSAEFVEKAPPVILLKSKKTGISLNKKNGFENSVVNSA
jgi:hypothetical protein